MIGRQHRFHGYHGLQPVYRRGSAVRSGALSLKFLPRAASRPYRVAVVVSRKVSKSAVVRNRIRRRIYEIVRSIPPTSYDLVFTVFHEQVAEMPTEKLAAQVRELLDRVDH